MRELDGSAHLANEIAIRLTGFLKVSIGPEARLHESARCPRVAGCCCQACERNASTPESPEQLMQRSGPDAEAESDRIADHQIDIDEIGREIT
jgi:hypothetical protein